MPAPSQTKTALSVASVGTKKGRGGAGIARSVQWRTKSMPTPARAMTAMEADEDDECRARRSYVARGVDEGTKPEEPKPPDQAEVL